MSCSSKVAVWRGRFACCVCHLVRCELCSVCVAPPGMLTRVTNATITCGVLAAPSAIARTTARTAPHEYCRAARTVMHDRMVEALAELPRRRVQAGRVLKVVHAPEPTAHDIV